MNAAVNLAHWPRIHLCVIQVQIQGTQGPEAHQDTGTQGPETLTIRRHTLVQIHQDTGRHTMVQVHQDKALTARTLTRSAINKTIETLATTKGAVGMPR